MSAATPFRALAWKDSQMILPLAGVLAALAAVLYAVTLGLPGDRGGVFYAYVLLLPNLVALGAPALLIGHEEESGTLHWQRSLPIDWRAVWMSKWMASLVALLLVWTVCAAGFLIAGVSGQLPGGGMGRGGFDWNAIWSEGYRGLSFSLMLLGTSLLAAWALRSPTAGLLVTVPLVGLLTIAAAMVGNEILAALQLDTGVASSGPLSLWIGHAQITIVAGLVLLTAGLAKRRWMNPETSTPSLAHWFGRRRRSGARAAAADAVILMLDRPLAGPRAALVWQSVRQSRGVLATAVLVGMIGIGMYLVTHSGPGPKSRGEGWLFSCLAISSTLAGASCFIGDTRSGRHRFLAQQGLSPWTVWWTRVLVPLVIAVALGIAVSLVVQRELIANTSQTEIFVTAMIGTLFVAGSICGMWAKRTAVGYLGAAVLATILWSIAGLTLSVYGEYMILAVPALMVLLFATLRMTGRWMDAQRDGGFHSRFVLWIMLACLTLQLPIAVHRWWTIPPVMPDWRQATFANARSLEPVDPEPQYSANGVAAPFFVSFVDANSLVVPGSAQIHLAKLIEQRWNNEPIHSIDFGVFAYLERLLTKYRSQPLPLPDDVSWSGYRGLLEVAIGQIEGASQRPWLRQSDLVDWIEGTVAEELARPASRIALGDADWQDLVLRLRTPDQRKKDRRQALLISWAVLNLETEEPNSSLGARVTGRIPNPVQQLNAPTSVLVASNQLPEPYGLTLGIGGYPSDYMPRLVLFAPERRRAWRFADLATRISLEQLESGLPSADSPETYRRLSAWHQLLRGTELDRDAFSTEETVPGIVDLEGERVTLYWNREFEALVEGTRGLANSR